jgi:pimeloyl-[acyl-carrier protein] methyl ester esterase
VIQPTLLFVHGWGFGPSFWEPLRDRLPDWPHAIADLGYFGKAQWPMPAGPVVGIGHSYGLAQLLQAPLPQCGGIISINGFARFTACSDFPHGTPTRIVERMLMRLPSDPIGVVNNFRKRCRGQATDESPNVERLTTALRNMCDADPREALARSEKSFIALASEDDPIVLPDMTRASFAAEHIQWSARGGHLLPLSEPSWCAMHIRAFLDPLATKAETAP